MIHVCTPDTYRVSNLCDMVGQSFCSGWKIVFLIHVMRRKGFDSAGKRAERGKVALWWDAIRRILAGFQTV